MRNTEEVWSLVTTTAPMAGTAADLFREEALIADAKAEFARRRGRQGYDCPIPPGVAPALGMSVA